MDFNQKILTFNISAIPFWQHPYVRMREFAHQAERLDLDFINLQEVHTYDAFILLKMHLPSYSYASYIPGVVGPRAGLVAFSKLPFTKKEFIKLGLHTGILISYFSDLHVYNVHLGANTDGDWAPTNRFYAKHTAQLHILHTATQKYSTALVAGDFNIARTCPAYRHFIRTGGWHDAFENNNAPTFHAAFLPANREPQCIDYILTKGSYSTSESAILFTDKVTLQNGRKAFLSNHKGLVACVVKTTA